MSFAWPGVLGGVSEIHPIMRTKLRRPAAIAYDQTRRAGTFQPRPEAVLAKAARWAAGIVHEDGPGRDGLGKAGEVSHGAPCGATIRMRIARQSG
jgi:hypothetical protein